ncbi:MAG: sugar phosphate nucleotidyltransferase [Candidatus Marinimicrobia bacterium]|nr:sugar phosphate nucleotidyltransferase [Candidatus Neomarinimicrobiota bacterium]
MDKESVKKHLFVLILCGGGGTRLWPRSRNRMPKQFSKLVSQESLFQMTVKRFDGFVPWERIFVVTTTDAYGKLVQKQAPKIPQKNIIIEPLRRDTAMAYGLGALYIKKIDPEAVIVTETADHPIENVPVYLKNFMTSALAAAQGDFLVTTGIKPRSPHTGFGYIKRGKVFKEFNGQPVYKLEKFTEKPDLKTAQEYLKSGDYFWNSSLFVWRADSYLKALKKHEPKAGEVIEMIEKALDSPKEAAVIAKAYEQAPQISVDYAVAEKADNFYLVVGDFGWEDVGNWRVVYELLKKDKKGNAVLKFGKKGEFIGINAKNNLVQFDDQLIALIDVEDLVVVDAEGIVLVCPKEKAENVKKMVEDLKKRGRHEYL